MHPIIFMAFTDIAPIKNVNAAIGAVGKLDAAKPLIANLKKIGFMFGDET